MRTLKNSTNLILLLEQTVIKTSIILV